MKDFKQFTIESRRLALLRLIVESGGSINESVAHTALTQMLGFPLAARKDVRDDFEWMEERRLLRIDGLKGSGDQVLLIAKVTPLGLDAAAGRGEPIEGLQRPLIAG
jgi:hypothetical protein